MEACTTEKVPYVYVPEALKLGMFAVMTRYFPNHLLPRGVQPEQVRAPVYYVRWPLGHLLQQSVAQNGVAMAPAHMNQLEMPAWTHRAMGRMSHMAMARRSPLVYAGRINEPAKVVRNLPPEAICATGALLTCAMGALQTQSEHWSMKSGKPGKWVARGIRRAHR